MAPGEEPRGPGSPTGTIRVEIVYAPGPQAVDLGALQLAAPATVADALRASGVLQRHQLDMGALCVGVFARACTLEQPLRDGDRVEIYRALQVDPKAARRLREQAHGPAKR